MKKTVMKKTVLRTILFPLLVFLAVLPVPAAAKNVGTYTLTLPTGSGVVMGDSNATLRFTLTNTSPAGSPSIDFVKFEFPNNIYDVSFSNLAPPGWNRKKIDDKKKVEFEATTGELAPGESAVFELVVVGQDDGPFPADVNDVSDILNKIDVKDGKDKFVGVSPSWKRYGLSCAVIAAPASVGTGDNITVSMLVGNRTTVTQTGVSPQSLSLTGTGGAVLTSGPFPASATLDPGEIQVFVYTYQAGAPGTVTFTGSAWNGTSLVTSPPVASNQVVIGDFTAQMAVAPSRVVSGQQVTATMTVTNNGSTTLAGIVPQISTSGSASISLVSGPTPAGLASLPPGSSSIFQWLYTVSGSAGDTYRFTGSASSATLATNSADSQQGEIFAYSVIVAPDILSSGATNVSFVYTVYNGSPLDVRQVRINTPPGWNYQSSAAPPGWSIKADSKRVRFRDSTIPAGESAQFTLTFSSIPTVTDPTPYNFLVELWDSDTKLDKDASGAVEVIVTVSPYQVALTSTVPGGSPTPPVADGFQYYDLTATVTDSIGPVAGAVVLFTSTQGSLGSGSAVTDAAGQATNALTGPLSTVPVNATVTAYYLGATGTLLLPFDPYIGLALDYLPGSLGPTTATAGSTGIVFSVSVINTGTASVDLAEALTYFIFDDASVGGSSSFQATLDNSNPALIPSGGTSILTFLAGDVDAGFSPGSFLPQLFIHNGILSGIRPVTDSVTITGSGTKVIIIRWRESIQ